MQLSELDRKIIGNLHSLPLKDQQAILEYTQILKNRIKKDTHVQTSFGIKLKEFLKEVKLDPIDIETSIFDDYRKSVTDRDFKWED